MRVTDGNITIALTGNGSSSQNFVNQKLDIDSGGLNESLYKSIGAVPVKVEGEKGFVYEYENQLYSEPEMAEIYTNLLKSTGGGDTPKFKTGDVVYSTNVPEFHFGVMSWEDYVKNPTNSMDTKMPIGLVVDPVKRTFLFCALIHNNFCSSDNIETYFGGYTSFEDGAETFERISKLKTTSKASDIPIFYALRNQNWGGTMFYVKNEVSYVPAIEEWKIAKEHLCTAFYGDDDNYAGVMDRLIALRDGITPSSSLFIGTHNDGSPKLFYSQISTVGKTVFGDGTFANAAFNMNGEIPNWDNTAQYVANCCPVFGIYTEEEENA